MPVNTEKKLIVASGNAVRKIPVMKQVIEDMFRLPVQISYNKEEASVGAALSWIKKDDTDYLFYTVRMADNSPAPIRRSISKDGYHFDKDNDFSIILSKKYNGESARDPKVILADDGLYHMFLTTSLEAEQKGCLAHLISKDLYKWEETENPIYISESSDQPECPDYIKYNGYYYLIFSLRGKAHYIISQNPLDGWRMPENPIIPCDSVPKGAVWNDKIMFTGFKPINDYAGTMTFVAATNDENGILIFE